MTYSDDIAVKALKNGNDKAFTWIYNKYFHSLCFHAEKIVESLEVAEDIVQDLFMTLLTNREKIDITTSLKAYLHVSVRKSCLKHIEYINVRRKYHDFLVENTDSHDNENPLSTLIANETESEIVRVIEALPPQYKEVMAMKLEELSYEEIAEKLGIPVGSIGPQINRARKKLLKLIEKQG